MASDVEHALARIRTSRPAIQCPNLRTLPKIPLCSTRSRDLKPQRLSERAPGQELWLDGPFISYSVHPYTPPVSMAEARVPGTSPIILANGLYSASQFSALYSSYRLPTSPVWVGWLATLTSARVLSLMTAVDHDAQLLLEVLTIIRTEGHYTPLFSLARLPSSL